MQISSEGTAQVTDATGKFRKELQLSTEKPDPADFGLVQIAEEPNPLPLNYQLIQLKRQEAVLRSIAKDYPGLLRVTSSQRRQQL